MLGILFKANCYQYIANMELEEAFPIIQGVLVEYMDSRIYQQYLFNNILMQLDGKGMNYLEYLKKNSIGSPSATRKATDYKKEKHNNNILLEKFKRQGGVVEPL